MKQIITLGLALAIAFTTVAQNAVESAFNFKKVMVPSLSMEALAPKKITEKAILDKLSARFGKSKGEKDFEVFKGIRIPEVGPDVYDMYVYTDKKSKKEDDKSIVTILISLGNENWISNTTNPTVIANAKTFMQSMLPWVAAGNLDKQIADAEDEYKKLTKKYDNSVDDGKKLEKKKADIEKDILDNKTEQSTKKADAEKQRLAVEALKAQKKG
jgi:hypothetical protein